MNKSLLFCKSFSKIVFNFYRPDFPKLASLGLIISTKGSSISYEDVIILHEINLKSRGDRV